MKRSRITLVFCLGVPALLTLSIACSPNETTRDKPLKPGKGRGNPGAAASAEPGRKNENAAQNEPQALQVLMTANDAQIQEGKMAKSMATSPDVKAFGEAVVADHTAANEQLIDLVQKKGITLEPSKASDRMLFDSNATLGHFKHMSPDMFDRAFMNRQVNVHKSLLGVIDSDTAKLVVDPELKGVVASMRDTIAKHLEQAQTITKGLPTAPTGKPTGSDDDADAVTAADGGSGGGGGGGSGAAEDSL